MVRYLAMIVSMVAVLLFGAGCKGDCRKLAEKLCDCAANTTEKNQCLTNAATEQGRVGTTPADETLCAQLYDGCDCHTVNTAQGKQACGLARLPPDAGAGGG